MRGIGGAFEVAGVRPTDKLVFEVEPQAGLTVVWNAKEVLTAWTALKHRNLTMYVPDNPNNRYWFPLWFDYVRQVYDKQVETCDPNGCPQNTATLYNFAPGTTLKVERDYSELLGK